MSERTGADLFVDALESYGVEHVFGNPGTTELPIMRALEDSALEYVLALHEDIAVGMAAGYAQTRRHHADRDPSIRPVGVVNLHTTPGTAHGVGNLYNASVTGAPLVVTAGDHSTDFGVREPILSGDLRALTDQFCKWSTVVPDVRTLPLHLRRAFRVALTPPTGPVFLGLPMDVTRAETDLEPERLGEIPTGGAGDPEQIDRAAAYLVDADRPVLVVGDHVARAGPDAVAAAVELAEAAGARVHGEILACEVDFPTGHDQWVSYIPPDADLARTLMDTDTLVLAGCSTNTTLTRHEGELIDRDTTIVQLSDAAWEVGKNDPADAAILGDPGDVMSQLADRVRDRLDAGALEARLEDVAAFKAMVDQQMRAMGEDEADDPRASKAELVDALRAAVPDAYIVDEGVTAKYAMLTRWPFEAEQYVSNKGGGLGYGLPAAAGAAMAETMADDPRPVVGFVGDGSYLYYPHTLYTAARYGVELVVVIPDNRNYRILKDNTLDLFGGDESSHEFIGMDFDPPVDIPMNAESHGATGRLVERPDEIEPAIHEGLEADGPVVLDVLVHD
ncbi:MAG: thiamine pyrophosphate-binding protein [Halobacteriales archaeon]|nr:thiamine pyrophosphate-binding protein [Halobacteriales archaeon]